MTSLIVLEGRHYPMRVCAGIAPGEHVSDNGSP